ncbi:MAG: hypothetical protein AAF961_08095 [Planctomycetota bacterium]
MADDPRQFDDQEDDELELEPVDADVLRHERERAQQRTKQALSKVDVDELLREDERDELDVDLSGLKQFRFSTRHLLIVTALLAVALTLKELVGGCNAIFLIGLATLAAGWLWTLRTERIRALERQRRREEFTAGLSGAEEGAFDEMEEPEADGRPQFEFRFSMQQLLGAFAVAAVILAMLQFLPAKQISLVLGLVALLGLAVHAAGFDPPRIVILGWWFLLAMYLAMGLLAGLLPEPEAAAKLSTPKSTLNVKIADVEDAGPWASDAWPHHVAL